MGAVPTGVDCRAADGQASIAAQRTAPTPNDRQSTQSLCRSRRAEFELRIPGRRSCTGMAREGTRREAEEWNEDRLKVLLPRLPDVGRALIKCDGERHRCSLPICAVCARAYRQGPIAQLHALANAYAGPDEVATIYLGLFPPGSLADADVPRTARNVSETSGPRGLQGREGGGRNRGCLARELAALAPARPSARHRRRRERLGAARSRLARQRHRGPVRSVALRNLDEQLSYCIKFVTYHQPGRRLVPLPPDRLVELAAWWSRHRFEDYLFAYGARRRGGRLVVDK